MRKSECVNLLARNLGVRATRLTSLVQRLSEAGLLPTASGPPFPQVSPVEIARMLIVAVCDEGLGAAPATIAKYGGLHGSGSTLEETLGHLLTRPEPIPPSHSELVISIGDAPSATLKMATHDGVRECVFKGPDTWRQWGAERKVTISGAALFAIAAEINGTSPADVDALLEGATEMKPAAEAV
jgi:hypothetical protein